MATAPTTGTDVSKSIGWADGTSLQGSAAESLVEALTAMLRVSTVPPVLLTLAGDTPGVLAGVDSMIALAEFAEAGDFLANVRDTQDAAKSATDVASIAYQVFDKGIQNAECTFTLAGEYPDIGSAASLSAQRLDLPGAMITQHGKTFPGVGTTPITQGELDVLISKRCNVYTRVMNIPTLFGGFTGRAGSWSDAVYWVLWLKNRMSLAIFNAMRASRRFSTAQLEDTIHRTMSVAVRSGGILPGGTVNVGLKEEIRRATGNFDFDGTLGQGYLVWVEQPSVRTDLDRENRLGRFKLWIAPSDAIHKVVGDIVLSG